VLWYSIGVGMCLGLGLDGMGLEGMGLDGHGLKRAWAKTGMGLGWSRYRGKVSRPGVPGIWVYDIL
jgi:hypothetical protein